MNHEAIELEEYKPEEISPEVQSLLDKQNGRLKPLPDPALKSKTKETYPVEGNKEIAFVIKDNEYYVGFDSTGHVPTLFLREARKFTSPEAASLFIIQSDGLPYFAKYLCPAVQKIVITRLSTSTYEEV